MENTLDGMSFALVGWLFFVPYKHVYVPLCYKDIVENRIEELKERIPCIFH